jgi:hypothetical protein
MGWVERVALDRGRKSRLVIKRYTYWSCMLLMVVYNFASHSGLCNTSVNNVAMEWICYTEVGLCGDGTICEKHLCKNLTTGGCPGHEYNSVGNGYEHDPWLLGH